MKYTIRVVQTIRFFEVIHDIEANSKDEAIEIAYEEFQCNWENSRDIATETEILSIKEK